MNTVLTLSFTLLTDDKAATAKNDRTQENPPERAGKGYVFSVSSAGAYWQLHYIPKTWLLARA